MSIDSATYKQKFKALKCCVLMPTYNNATTIGAVVQDIMQYCDDICVVNDGSTDNTLQVLSQFPELKIHTYEKNAGKGWALRQGFKFALQNGYDYAITIDSDGQHFAKDLPTMLAALEENGEAIVIGARNMEQSSVPGKSSFGNKFSNFWFTLETGIDMPDTQSGYRLYPIKRLSEMRFFTYKYEFEIEVLVRAAWSGIKILAVPVKVYYPPAEERISHFRPFQDFSRISVLNTVLVFWTFAWIKPRDFFRHLKKKDFKVILEDYLIRSHETPHVKAFSIALGVFFGITPLWGLQMWFVLFFAWIFGLNKALSVLASNISIPPMIPLILFLSFEAGRLVLGHHAVHLVYSNKLTVEMINRSLLQYVLGSFILATICAVITGIGTFIFVSNLKKQRV
jgi:glycosyltransferase involved in cell wall biosynthesis